MLNVLDEILIWIIPRFIEVGFIGRCFPKNSIKLFISTTMVNAKVLTRCSKPTSLP